MIIFLWKLNYVPEVNVSMWWWRWTRRNCSRSSPAYDVWNPERTENGRRIKIFFLILTSDQLWTPVRWSTTLFSLTCAVQERTGQWPTARSHTASCCCRSAQGRLTQHPWGWFLQGVGTWAASLSAARGRTLLNGVLHRGHTLVWVWQLEQVRWPLLH